MESLRSSIRFIVEQRGTLNEEQAQLALSEILDETHEDTEISALLTAMATRGETQSELAGFVRAMRERMLPLPLSNEERAELVDPCGTGGDGIATLNMSICK